MKLITKQTKETVVEIPNSGFTVYQKQKDTTWKVFGIPFWREVNYAFTVKNIHFESNFNLTLDQCFEHIKRIMEVKNYNEAIDLFESIA